MVHRVSKRHPSRVVHIYRYAFGRFYLTPQARPRNTDAMQQFKIMIIHSLDVSKHKAPQKPIRFLQISSKKPTKTNENNLQKLFYKINTKSFGGSIFTDIPLHPLSKEGV
jgi:hypothetical protein